jgi:RNA polymerase sigma factor (TIGR02999 family)
MAPAERTSVAELLAAAARGESGATDELLPRVYSELRRIAAVQMSHERPGQTLQPTALVNEAYVRLVGDSEARWETHGHFFAAAARAMRRILVERARKRIRREGKGAREAADPALLAAPSGTTGEEVDVVRLDQSLQRLEARDKRKSDIVHLRYFAGLTIEQTAAATGLSVTTVKEEWLFAKAWLRRDLRGATGVEGDAADGRGGP